MGDPAQLPPVCRHVKSEDEVCARCHISNAVVWAGPNVHKYFLTFSIRHAADPAYLNLLQLIRLSRPREDEIHTVLDQCVHSPASIMAHLQNPANVNTKIICTHNEDVHQWNELLMRMRHPNAPRVKLRTNADNFESMCWAHSDGFHELKSIAVGCPIMMTLNVDISVGAVNGPLGRVIGWRTNDQQEVNRIDVRLDNGNVLRVNRTVTKRLFIGSKVFFKSTFPLVPAFAITGHKSQGCTITGAVILHIKHSFCPGLLYVMLSRVLRRDQIF
jgi:ATP-dependent exoDNAse (exonuclease V) alpha subunit